MYSCKNQNAYIMSSKKKMRTIYIYLCTIWGHLQEFGFGRQLCATEKPTYVARSTSLADQGGLRQLGSGKLCCIWLSDVWSVMVRLGYASPNGAILFCWSSHWNHINLCLFCHWVFRCWLHLACSLLLNLTTMSHPTGVQTPDSCALGITGTHKPSTMNCKGTPA